VKAISKKLITLLFFSYSSVALSCPSCKDALGTEAAKSLAQGYYWSILLMLSLPFILSGFIALLIIKAHRSKKTVQPLKIQDLS
jgi:hypothetical protein